MALVQATHMATGLTLKALHMPSLSVTRPDEASEALSVSIWKNTVKVVAADSRADEWFSEYPGQSCRLVYIRNPKARPADEIYAQPGSVVSFVDGFPLLLTSHASLADLNARLMDPLPQDALQLFFENRRHHIGIPYSDMEGYSR